MSEREKIAQLLCKQTGSNENRECETCPFNGCIAQRQADALIAANIGDVTAWKERAEKAEERLEKLKKTDGNLTIEDEINMLENIVEEAKRRSFVFERELVKHKIAFDKAIKLAYKIRTDFDVLSCSSCEFGYAFDVCKKTGLYSDCENRWKEELLQQAEARLNELKGDKQ